MKCVDAQRQMRAYIEGALSDKEAEQFLDHVQSCGDCREELELFLTISDTLRESGEEHPGAFLGVDRHIERARSGLHRRRLQRLAVYVLMVMAALLLAGLLYMAVSEGAAGNASRTEAPSEAETEEIHA